MSQQKRKVCSSSIHMFICSDANVEKQPNLKPWRMIEKIASSSRKRFLVANWNKYAMWWLEITSSISASIWRRCYHQRNTGLHLQPTLNWKISMASMKLKISSFLILNKISFVSSTVSMIYYLLSINYYLSIIYYLSMEAWMKRVRRTDR